MRVFAIGDLHLSHARPKPMSVFGEHWRDHDAKIANNWHAMAQPDDVLIITGDISWAIRLEDAKPDLDYIKQLPGHKVILKGNHDYWWSSKTKVRQLAAPSIEVLQADSVVIGEVAIVATRGWQCPGTQSAADIMVEGVRSSYTEEDFKIYQREVGRLRLAFASLHGKSYKHLICALHYPPVNAQHEPSDFTALIEQYPVDICVYGHLHSDAIRTAFNGIRNGIRYQLVSADSIDFTPLQIL
ncbi:MAG: metallophosphoesterase [Acidobacteriota bacterium]